MQMQLLVHREKRLYLSYLLLQCTKCNITPEQFMRTNNNQNTNLKALLKSSSMMRAEVTCII